MILEVSEESQTSLSLSLFDENADFLVDYIRPQE